MRQRISSIKCIIFLFTLSINFASGQANHDIQKLEDQNLIRILNKAILLTEKKTTNISIRVFKVGNQSGSAGLANSEITHNLYIAVSEYDELPSQSLFTFGPLYNPKANGWSGTGSEQNLAIEYGPHKQRKVLSLKISLDKVEIVN